MRHGGVSSRAIAAKLIDIERKRLEKEMRQ
jgi:hypothetical protein